MKWTIDNQRATELLNNGYLPQSGLRSDASEFAHIIDLLKNLLIESAQEIGINDFDDIGDIHYGFQDDHMIRAELLSWQMLQAGLLSQLAQFLQTHAPHYSITLTFDFDDELSRGLESPNITVFPSEIVGGFDLCDLSDTAELLGFKW